MRRTSQTTLAIPWFKIVDGRRRNLIKTYWFISKDMQLSS
jgi:hypothetical protein